MGKVTDRLYLGLFILFSGLFLLPSCGANYRNIAVEEVNGYVSAKGKEKTGQLVKGEHLVNGDYVEVSRESDLTMCADRTRFIYADPETGFRVEATDGKESRIKIVMEYGSTLHDITEKLDPGESYEVETPNSTMAVRGTTFRVTVLLDGKQGSYSLIEVTDGTVQVRLRTGEGEYTGEEALIEQGEAALVYGKEDASEFVFCKNDISSEELPEDAVDRLRKLIIEHSINPYDPDGPDGKGKSGPVKQASSVSASTSTSSSNSTAGTSSSKSSVSTSSSESTVSTSSSKSTAGTSDSKKSAASVSSTASASSASTQTAGSGQEIREPEQTPAPNQEPESQSTAESQPEPTPAPSQEPESQPAAESQPEPEPEPQLTPETAPEPQPEPTPAPGQEPTSEPEPEPEPTPAHVHTPGEWENTKDPSCVEEGERVRKCTECGEIVESETIAPLGHMSFVPYYRDTAAGTCVYAGSGCYTEYICFLCGEPFDEVWVPGDPNNHVGWSEWYICPYEYADDGSGRVIKEQYYRECLGCHEYEYGKIFDAGTDPGP